MKLSCYQVDVSEEQDHSTCNLGINIKLNDLWMNIAMMMILNLHKYRLRRAARQEAKSRRLVSFVVKMKSLRHLSSFFC